MFMHIFVFYENRQNHHFYEQETHQEMRYPNVTDERTDEETDVQYTMTYDLLLQKRRLAIDIRSLHLSCNT